MLNANDQIVQEFLKACHEAGRAEFERSYQNLVYDRDKAKTATERSKYIALDVASGPGKSGFYLVDRETHQVWGIKGYGVPNKIAKHYHGTIEQFTQKMLTRGSDRTR